MTHPAESVHDVASAVAQAHPTLPPRRRRLLAGAAALAAGVLAARTTTSAHAADADVLVIGNTGQPVPGPQTSSSRSELRRSNPTVIDDALCVSNDNGAAVRGKSSNFIGVAGEGGNGVLGVTNIANGTGVVGYGDVGDSVGVYGMGNSAGVAGEGQTGVRGTSAFANGTGVQGRSMTGVGVLGEGPTGVRGRTTADWSAASPGIRSAVEGAVGSPEGLALTQGRLGTPDWFGKSIGVYGSSSTYQNLRAGKDGVIGVYGDAHSDVVGVPAVGVYAEADGWAGVAVYGKCPKSPANPDGRAGVFEGDVYVHGDVTTGNVEMHGNAQIWGALTAGAIGKTSTIYGDVWVVGNLHKPAGSFRIDHPLDPANQYLVHSFVESPDMMNVYNGNVTTDASGEAIVRLPSYFDALNREFRYQLTVLGQFAQAIIASKIHDNQFTIRTDKPGVEVSWQVTGVRKDPYAEQHRIVPEEPKTGAHRGKYLHPDLYGHPETARVGYRAQVETAPPALNVRHPDAKLADPLSPSVTTTIRRPTTFQKP